MKGKTILISLSDGLYIPLSSHDVIEGFMRAATAACFQNPVTKGSGSLEVTGQADKDGITAWVILMESHFFIHTWPLQGYVRIEMSTCRPPDDEAIKALAYTIKRTFGGAVNMEIKLWNEGDLA